jgi:hypothetical protein
VNRVNDLSRSTLARSSTPTTLSGRVRGKEAVQPANRSVRPVRNAMALSGALKSFSMSPLCSRHSFAPVGFPWRVLGYDATTSASRPAVRRAASRNITTSRYIGILNGIPIFRYHDNWNYNGVTSAASGKNSSRSPFRVFDGHDGRELQSPRYRYYWKLHLFGDATSRIRSLIALRCLSSPEHEEAREAIRCHCQLCTRVTQ